MPRELRLLALHNFALSDTDLDLVGRTRSPRLQRAHLHLSEEQYERLQAYLPHASVFPYIDYDEEAIRSTRLRDGSDGFEFNSDVAEHWGFDAAVDAANALETKLERVAPQVATRVDVALDGGSLWISGARRTDVEVVRALILRHSQKA